MDAAHGDALIGCGDLVAAITARVHPDDLLAWSLACRAFNGARVEGGRALITRASRYGGSVDGASWAHGVGAPIGMLRRGAADAGSVPVLRWSETSAGSPIDGSACYCLCIRAARAGSVDALAWLRAHGSCKGCEWSHTTQICAAAAEGGHLSVLQWARSQDPPCPWDAETSAQAARGGHLPVLQWARAQDPPCPWGVRTCSEAAREGRLAVLQWVRSQNPPCAWNLVACGHAARRKGHGEVVAWLRVAASGRWDGSYIRKFTIYRARPRGRE